MTNDDDFKHIKINLTTFFFIKKEYNYSRMSTFFFYLSLKKISFIVCC